MSRSCSCRHGRVTWRPWILLYVLYLAARREVAWRCFLSESMLILFHYECVYEFSGSKEDRRRFSDRYSSEHNSSATTKQWRAICTSITSFTSRISSQTIHNNTFDVYNGQSDGRRLLHSQFIVTCRLIIAGVRPCNLWCKRAMRRARWVRILAKAHVPFEWTYTFTKTNIISKQIAYYSYTNT